MPAVTRGICPYAGAMIDAVQSGIDASALVLTTVCDQMRYAAAVIESRGTCPVFLLNVPSTWQTPRCVSSTSTSSDAWADSWCNWAEKSPDSAELARVMLAYDRERLAILRSSH